MKRKNILLVTGNFPPGIGGMQSYYHHLCRNSKHHVTVLAPHYDNDAAFDAAQPYKIIRGNFFQNERIHISSWRHLYKMTVKTIKEQRIDVTIYGFVLIGFIGLLLNLFMGKKYMISTHGKDMMEFRHVPVLKFLIKQILKRADGVLTNSEFTKELVMQYGVDPSKIELIYPGVDAAYEPQEKHPELVAKFGLEGRYVLLTLGRLVKRKGHDMVIRSLPSIRKDIPNVVYVIVGDGPERERLEQLAAELGVSDCVVFAGRVDETRELKTYYNLCDQFIMASRVLKLKGDVEGFGIVYMEAASCRKPVVAGDSGGVREAVLHEETGLLVDPNSEASIAEGVVRMYRDAELRERLVDNAYNRAKTQFQYPYLAEQLDRYLIHVCVHGQQVAWRRDEERAGMHA